jgi:hypothetical protein
MLSLLFLELFDHLGDLPDDVVHLVALRYHFVRSISQQAIVVLNAGLAREAGFLDRESHDVHDVLLDD